MEEVFKPETVRLSELKLDLENLRGHNEEEVDLLVKSLTIFGQFKPIYVDKNTMTVKIGNGRLMAMRKMGWTECQCVLLDWNSRNGMEVADNRINELSDWECKTFNAWIAKKGSDWWGMDEKMARKAIRAAEKDKTDNPTEKENSIGSEISEKPLCPHCGKPLVKKKRMTLD